MLEGIRAKQEFSFDEYQTMLMLQCGINPAEGDAGIGTATDRNYSVYVIDLHGLELETSSKEESYGIAN
jgi:exocyst complex component 4